MSLAENVRTLRERAGMTQAELAEKLGKGQTTIQKIETGQTIRPRFLEEMAAVLGVSPHELQYGDTTKIEKAESNAKDFGSFRLWSGNDPLPEDEYYYAPFYKDIAMMGGAGSTEMEDYNGFRLPFGKASLYRNGITPSNVSCCTLTGDSMEPVIPDGATIGIDQGETTIRDGKIYAFRHDDVYRVKRLYLLPGGKVRINSFNQDEPAYRDEIVSLAEIEIIGRGFNWSVMAP
nr:MAG TPA: Repressor protein CI [Caudoviricetes sp.]